MKNKTIELHQSSLLYILDDTGAIVQCQDVVAWAEWMSSADRQIAATTIGWLDDEKIEPIQVVTHFVGFDYGFGRTAKPILYETIVFGGQLNHHTERADDHYLALRRHYLTVDTVLIIEKAYHKRNTLALKRQFELMKILDEETGQNLSALTCPKCGGTRAHRIDCEDEIGFA